MNPAAVTTLKTVGAAVAVVVVAIAIYLQAVLGVYILAWVVQLIGTIF